MKIGMVGGQVIQRNLTLELQKKNPSEYETGKVVFWLGMLRKRMKPVKWLKPNKNGTKVKFETLFDQASYDAAWGEFEEYLKGINVEYNLDLKLVDKE